jgi:hypothetical protein
MGHLIKVIQSFEQNKVKGLSGWDSFQKRAMGVWWGSVSRISQRGTPLYPACGLNESYLATMNIGLRLASFGWV